MMLRIFFLIFILSFFKDVNAQQTTPPNPLGGLLAPTAGGGIGSLLAGATAANSAAAATSAAATTATPATATTPDTTTVGGIVGQLTGDTANPTPSVTDDSLQGMESSAPSDQSPLNALTPPLGVDPKLMDAEGFVPTTNSTGKSTTIGGSVSNAPPPDLDILWKCKKDPAANKNICMNAIQLFCSGRCTRLNCMVPTNYVTCIDVCGESATMIQPCVDAGKRNPGPAQIMNVAGAFDPASPPPPPTDTSDDGSNPNAQNGAAAPGMGGMDPQMMQQMMMMQMAGQAGGALAQGVGAGLGAAAKGVGSLVSKIP